MPTRDKLIRTSHATLALRDSENDKLPVLFLHARSASKDVFHHQFESPLADEFRLLALDLPGHGASSDAVSPDTTYAIEGYADAVIQVLEWLGIDKMAVVGWGLGGRIAEEMTTTFPAIAGVMLVGGAPSGGQHAPEVPSPGFRPHPDLSLASQASLDDDEIVRLAHMLTGSRHDPRLEAAIRRSDGRARATPTECPRGAPHRATHVKLAVVNGEQDPTFDAAATRAVRSDALWDGRCRVVPNIGHMPFAQIPDIFNQLLRRYLRALEKRSDDALRRAGLPMSA